MFEDLTEIATLLARDFESEQDKLILLQKIIDALIIGLFDEKVLNAVMLVTPEREGNKLSIVRSLISTNMAPALLSVMLKEALEEISNPSKLH